MTELAAGALRVSLRQAQRMVARYREGGGGALIHKSRGRQASNKLAQGVRELVLELVRLTTLISGRHSRRRFGGAAPYRGITRGLAQVDGRGRRVAVMQAAQELPSDKAATQSYGELIQIDGSEHRWFEDHGEPCTLLVFIDSATSSWMQLRFLLNESRNLRVAPVNRS